MIQRLPGAAPPSPEPVRGYAQLPLSLLSPLPSASGVVVVGGGSSGGAEVIFDDTREDGSGGSTPIMTPGDAPMLHSSRPMVPYGVIARGGAASSSRRPAASPAAAELGEGYGSQSSSQPSTPAGGSYDGHSTESLGARGGYDGYSNESLGALGAAHADGRASPSSSSLSPSPSPSVKRVRWNDECGLPLWDVRRGASRGCATRAAVLRGRTLTSPTPFPALSPAPPRDPSDTLFKQVALQPARRLPRHLLYDCLSAERALSAHGASFLAFF